MNTDRRLIALEFFRNWTNYVVITTVAALLTSFPIHAQQPKAKIRMLLITGGHEYPTSFYTLFQGYPDVQWDHTFHCGSAEAYAPKMAERYDVVVLYDVQRDAPEARRQNLMQFVEAGGGVVALHHVLASVPPWEEFHELIGGKYLWSGERGLPPSTYQYDVDMRIHVADRSHPVTRDLRDFDIRDEAYGGLWVSPSALVLLTTNHPASNKAVAWVMPHSKARIVTIQLGHGEEAFANRSYRSILIQAIRWAAQQQLAR